MLVLYDWIVSLGREYEFTWTKGLTWFKLLYFVARYAGIAKAIMLHWTAWISDERVSICCDARTTAPTHDALDVSLRVRRRSFLVLNLGCSCRNGHDAFIVFDVSTSLAVAGQSGFRSRINHQADLIHQLSVLYESVRFAVLPCSRSS